MLRRRVPPGRGRDRNEAFLRPALNDAKEKGQDLIAVCSACYHVLKRVNDDMKNDADTQLRANNYLGLDKPYRGETRVLHFLEVLRDRVGFDEVKKKVVKPLTGRKIGAYYGCLLLRPSAVMAFGRPGKIPPSWRILSGRWGRSLWYTPTATSAAAGTYP